MNTPSILSRIQDKITGKSGNTLAQLEADQARLAANLAQLEAERANIAGQIQASRDEADQAIIDAAREATAAALAVTERERERLAIEREKERKALRAEKEKQLATIIHECETTFARQLEMVKEMVGLEARARDLWTEVRKHYARDRHIRLTVAQLQKELADLGATSIPETPHIPNDMSFLNALAEAIRTLPPVPNPDIAGTLAFRFIGERLRAWKL